MNTDLLVSIHNDHTLKTVDIKSGAIKYITQVGGKIIQGPVMSGDSVTVTIQTPTGKIGKIFKLPRLVVSRTFKVD